MGTTTRKAILAKLEALVELAPGMGGTLEDFADAAIETFSKDRPYEDVDDVTVATAGHLQEPPTNWEQDWSVITKIVYPYEDEDSTVLDDGDYRIEKIPVSSVPTARIRFISQTPAVDDVFRIWFTRRHVCTESSCTVRTADLLAVVYMAAYLAEQSKASHYNSLRNQAVEVDLVDFGNKAAQAHAAATGWKKLYNELLGLSEGGVGAASVSGDLDADPQYPYVSHLRYHRRANR